MCELDPQTMRPLRLRRTLVLDTSGTIWEGSGNWRDRFARERLYNRQRLAAL
jgi:hypothetical protein